ncbi:hypothetical protein O7632_18090 [Solwaraspora sp. WMMD406]|uniref:hypothetical protein n=1 Tax=Solwaraspora sp. WMMD406 TaxID=3016095 RepID=UPI00241659EE|nr:hypothetical protein [Solwaraspora sp. WMMD406]MDG4765997.1 hypothetical protein [Solwaraspora sp. WMMD406]
MRQRWWAWQMVPALAGLALLGPMTVITGAAGTAPQSPYERLVSLVEPLAVAPGGPTEPSGPTPARSATTDATTPSDGESGANVRYYVVEELPGGERDFLFAIAARTLGDGRRYREIFDLNVGRVQPDGGELTDPTRVEPGWVLRLPDDARGAGVRYGPLPTPVPDVSPREPRDTAVAAPDRRSELLIRGGAAMAAIGLFALAVLVLRRGRTTAPARLPATPARTQPESRPRPAAAQRPAVPPRPASAAAATAMAAARPADTATRPRDTIMRPGGAVRPGDAVPRPGDTIMHPSGAAPLVVTTPGNAEPPQADSAPATGDATPEADTSDGQTPLHLTAAIRVGDDPAVLRLIGARQARGGPPYRWMAGPQPPVGAASGTLVPIGDGADGRLWIDLRQAPDVLVITGPVGPRERAARLLLDRLLAAGSSVSVVGTAIDPLPAGCRRMSVTDTAEPDLGTAAVTVFADPGPEALADVHALASRPDWPTVPVVVSAGPAARWTLRMGDD